MVGEDSGLVGQGGLGVQRAAADHGGRQGRYRVGLGARSEKQRGWKGGQSGLTNHQGRMENEPGERRADPRLQSSEPCALPSLLQRGRGKGLQRRGRKGRTWRTVAQEGAGQTRRPQQAEGILC